MKNYLNNRCFSHSIWPYFKQVNKLIMHLTSLYLRKQWNGHGYNSILFRVVYKLVILSWFCQLYSKNLSDHSMNYTSFFLLKYEYYLCNIVHVYSLTYKIYNTKNIDSLVNWFAAIFQYQDLLFFGPFYTFSIGPLSLKKGCRDSVFLSVVFSMFKILQTTIYIYYKINWLPPLV